MNARQNKDNNCTPPGIYIIRNLTNGRAYVGSSIDIANRIKQHVVALRNNKHSNPYLQRAWNKYGEDNFALIPYVCGMDKRLSVEQRTMDLYKSEGGIYNIYPKAGSPFGFRHSEESKQKMSLIKKEFWKNNKGLATGVNNPFYGKVHSKESCQKISNANKGTLKGNKNALGNKFKHTPEALQKLKNSWNNPERRKLASKRGKERIFYRKNGKFSKQIQS